MTDVSPGEGRDSATVKTSLEAEDETNYEDFQHEAEDGLLEADEEIQRLQQIAAAAGHNDVAAGGEESVSTEDTDRRSVYVGQVDYSTTPEELQEHFKSCGTINRITILVDKFTGHPKGFDNFGLSVLLIHMMMSASA
eukprot:GHVL01022443.1.p1 GENE.GHVL01022443.1~~GHVL01022443.1.p1  ORF type:complete len:138 (+),score=21.25 GHVL01022443.1:44-457(+)